MRPLPSILTKPKETSEYLAERRLAGGKNHFGSGTALAGLIVSFTIAPLPD